jgi:hypothetical protein
VGAEYGYGDVLPRELVSYRSAEPFLARMDDRPSTGPLGRSEKAALVSGSSSALRGRRRRVSVGWAAAARGWVLAARGWVLAARGWVLAARGWVLAARGWAAARTG